MSTKSSEIKIVVTGGAGFLGSYVIKNLQQRGYKDIFVPTIDQYNLVQQEAVRQLYQDTQPDIIIHLAAQVGGIGANIKNPGSYFYDNLMMGTQLMEEGRLNGIKKFIAIGTVCSYPKNTPIPFREEDLWKGYPEETNAPYGLAKKMLLVQSQAYRKQYNFPAIYLIPTNLYGPKDNFNPQSSHVIPALIKKCLDAVSSNSRQIEVWGTGQATRDFIFVEDCANAIVDAMEKYNDPQPLNIGSGQEISIKNLTEIIAKITGFQGKIKWDTSKPDGQPRRRLDISMAAQKLGFKPTTNLEDGLQQTLSWYKKQFVEI